MARRTCLPLSILAALLSFGCHVGRNPPEFSELPGLTANPPARITVHVAAGPGDAKRENLLRAIRTGLGCTEEDAQKWSDSLISMGHATVEGLPPDRARAVVEALRAVGASARDYEVCFYVVGEVKHPGPLPFVGQTTLAQAIELAGGFSDAADRKRLEVRRREGSTEQWSYKHITGAHTHGPYIFPGDTLEVKKRTFIWW